MTSETVQPPAVFVDALNGYKVPDVALGYLERMLEHGAEMKLEFDAGNPALASGSIVEEIAFLQANREKDWFLEEFDRFLDALRIRMNGRWCRLEWQEDILAVDVEDRWCYEHDQYLSVCRSTGSWTGM